MSLKFLPQGVGSSTLTASSSGLGSSTATLKVLAFPFSANLTLSTPSFIYANQTDVATLQVDLLGQPLQGVNVTWAYFGVVPIPTNGTTNSAGEVSTMLRPVGPGDANITATATGAGFGKLQVTAQLAILQVPPTPKPTLVHQTLVLHLLHHNPHRRGSRSFSVPTANAKEECKSRAGSGLRSSLLVARRMWLHSKSTETVSLREQSQSRFALDGYSKKNARRSFV